MVELQPVEAVEVTVVVDNFVDVLMAGSEGVVRFPVAYDLFDDRERDQLVAEHGFSALVTVFSGGGRSSILYDGGLTPGGLVDVLQVDPAGLRAIAVSHGHVDHHGGLEGLAARTGRRRLPPPPSPTWASSGSSPATAPAGRLPTAWPRPSPRRSSSLGGDDVPVLSRTRAPAAPATTEAGAPVALHPAAASLGRP